MENESFSLWKDARQIVAQPKQVYYEGRINARDSTALIVETVIEYVHIEGNHRSVSSAPISGP